jgi:tetratricopeptide (TPR) repeat protein
MRKTSLKGPTNKRKLAISAKVGKSGKFRTSNRFQTSLKRNLKSGARLRRNSESALLKSGSKVTKSQVPRSRQVPRLSNSKERGSARRIHLIVPKVLPANPLRLASIKQYESAVRLLYAQNFERAKSAFEKLIQTSGEDKEILERARSHLRFCEQKIARKPPAPRSVEDLYNLAVTLMNEGKYHESIEHLNKALKNRPDCDYVLYALAATYCMTGNVDNALRNLRAAITLKPENRFLAQHDYDFEPLMQDSRFISIVFPERLATPPR